MELPSLWDEPKINSSSFLQILLLQERMRECYERRMPKVRRNSNWKAKGIRKWRWGFEFRFRRLRSRRAWRKHESNSGHHRCDRRRRGWILHKERSRICRGGMLGVVSHLTHDSSTGVYDSNIVSVVQNLYFLLSYIFRAIGRGGRVRSHAMKAVSFSRASSGVNTIRGKKTTTASHCLFAFTGQVWVTVMLTLEAPSRTRIDRPAPIQANTKSKRSRRTRGVKGHLTSARWWRNLSLLSDMLKWQALHDLLSLCMKRMWLVIILWQCWQEG